MSTSNNSNIPPFKIGDRIECGKYFGTIKYIGEVLGKPATWLGIDWDLPERGKHDGTVNGKRYFTTRHPTSGSFVRPEKVNFGKSVITSIVSRYGQTEDEHTTKVNQQKQLRLQQNMNAPFLEMVGFDKVFSKQSDISSLKVVNLREQNLNSAGQSSELKEACPIIEELDLSKNLFSSWTDIFKICEQLPNLYWLNVSENLLVIPEDYEKFSYPNVRTLICGHMELNWEDICKIAHCFPQVKELRSPFNKIQNLNSFHDILQSLEVIDLEGNSIEDWSEVSKLDAAYNLEEINLEKNNLKSIGFSETNTVTPTFKNLRKLCLVNNSISKWRSIGELNKLMNFENLKIFNNPVLEKEDPKVARQLIIARIANLKILNGVEIEPHERRGAEYDYMKKYGLEWLRVKGTEQEQEFLKEHPRYRELNERYGELEESELTVQSKMIRDCLIEVYITCGEKSLRKKLPPTLTVQKLAQLVQKLFRLQEIPDLVYISKENSDIHINLNDMFSEIGLYSMKNGDFITVLT